MEMYDILSRESENTQDVYLYEVGGHWYAYGVPPNSSSNCNKG